MPSRFLMELGYDPYGSSDGVGSVGFHDQDGDGFTDFGDFGEADFDPFPDDVPVYE